MQFKKIFLIFLLAASIEVSAQSSFSYSPERPQAGDAITITYTPSGQLAESKKPVMLKLYKLTGESERVYDGVIKKAGKHYTANITTDTSDVLIAVTFYNDEGVDENGEEGFLIPLYQGEEYRAGLGYAQAGFYTDILTNPQFDKALESIETEFEKHPETRDRQLVKYLRIYQKVKPEEFDKEVQKTIEATLKAELKDEDDYSRLQSLYALNKLTQQSDFIRKLKEEKFPDGKWTIQQTLNSYMSEPDVEKKEKLWKEISAKIDNDTDWKSFRPWKENYKTVLLNSFRQTKDWQGMDRMIEKWNIKGGALASQLNSIAWDMQEKNEDLLQAEKFAERATAWAKNEINKPTEPKPDYLTESEWKKNNERRYAMYADTYAMVEYKLGNYKKGFPYAEEAALKINNGNDASLNGTYALLAAKVLAPRKYMPQMEKMVREGKANAAIKDALKDAYVKRNGEAGYEQYIAALEKEALASLRAEVKKSMIDIEAPAWTLADVQGNQVNVADLRGKVVIVDFWATWCGPCKASFPGMQTAVTKYKADPNVAFLFINTWESGDDKVKIANDFIVENKYDFHVLMDNDNKVVEQFGVSGIPTKFVIDKNGKIRFKSVGFSGNDEKLVQELSLMIELAREA